MTSKEVMSRSTDQDIIDEIRAGNTEAFSLLVDRYKHFVYTTTNRFLKNREDSEEVAQDIFLKAYRSLQGFRGESKFSTWLYKIAYHKCLDHLKKKKVKHVTSIDAMPESYQPGYLDREMDRVEQKERVQQIREAILELPGNESWIMTMFYLEELSLKEIAQITGHTTNAIKVKLFRNRERLYHLLKEKLEPEIISAYEGRTGKKSG